MKKDKTITENENSVRGYKVFNPDFKCKDFQYAENTEYIFNNEIKICSSGFHFCIKASHCFSYYSFDSANIVCEVEGIGKILTHEEDSKTQATVTQATGTQAPSALVSLQCLISPIQNNCKRIFK